MTGNLTLFWLFNDSLANFRTIESGHQGKLLPPKAHVPVLNYECLPQARKKLKLYLYCICISMPS